MAMKGSIKPNHILLNTYRLIVQFLPPLTPVSVSGLDEELEVADLPDRTKASGGYTKAGSMTIKLPMHHIIERVAMEKWFSDSQEPVALDYKKAATLIHFDNAGRPIASYTLLGCFVMKRKTPDLELKNAGEMAEIEYTISWDDVVPV